MPFQKLLIPFCLSLSLIACGGDSGDSNEGSEDNTTGGSVDPNSNPPTTSGAPDDGFGQDGNADFRVLGFSTEANLMEGTDINVAVTLQRVNSHQRSVNLSARLDSGNQDSRLGFGFDQPALNGGQIQGTLNIRYNHGPRRATPTQHRLIIAANDGLVQSETTLVVNIQATTRPDIYLLAGQSNMVGFSEDFAKNIAAGGDDVRVDNIRQLNVTANDTNGFTGPESFATRDNQVGFPDFVVAEDPLHESRDPNMASKTGTRVGLGLSFAKRALSTDPNHQIILVPTAWSATGFCDTGDFLAQGPNVPDWIAQGELGWNPFPLADPVFGGTTLFTRAVVRTNMAIELSGGILRGILWHQGESDGDNADCAANYASNLQTLARELRTQITPDARGTTARGATADIPFIVGTLSRGVDERGDFSVLSNEKQIVENVLRNVASQNLIPLSGVALFDDLVPSNGFPCGEGSCVHFGSAAYREMGSRYFSVLEQILSTLP